MVRTLLINLGSLTVIFKKGLCLLSLKPYMFSLSVMVTEWMTCWCWAIWVSR